MAILQQPDQAGLLPFLALAALLHALLLALPLALEQPGPRPALRIVLAHPAPAGGPAAATTAPRTPPAPAPVPTSPPITPPIATGPAAGAAPAGPGLEAAPSAAAETARVLGQVRSALARHFTYPLLARRQGWQGEVLLGFSVTPDGRIDGIQVVRSSGHRLLDEAARTSLARVGSLPEYVSHGSESLSLQLPVIYRLAEG